MRYLLILPCLSTILFLAGCQTGGTWTADALTQWHEEITSGLPEKTSPLWYQGSDDKYHHFTCRSFDSWIPIQVPREQITIEDLRPYQDTSSSAVFPGYYKVDASKDFIKTE